MTEKAAIDYTKTSVYPTYALRAWLTALLAQTQVAQTNMQASIRNHETEIQRLREQIDHAGGVVKSLEHAIQRVDNELRRKRDVDATREIHNEGESIAAEASVRDSPDEKDALKKK